MRGSSVKEKGTRGLSWLAFLLAIVAGAAAAPTWIGDGIVAGLDLMPGWVTPSVFYGGLVAIAVDLFVDGEPNQIALAGVVLVPSAARGTNGKLAQAVTHATDGVLAKLGGLLGDLLGATSAIGLALVCAVVAGLMARRVMRKKAMA